MGAAMVEYFRIDGAPGEYFRCEKLMARLSVESCAQQYRRAKGGYSACTRCPIGAAHAGEELVVGLPSRLCLRCGGSDKRLIRGVVCISCYNRERELRLGRNAKGSFPAHARRVREADVFVAGVGRVRVERVADVAEAVLIALRRNPRAQVRPMMPPPPVRQLSLFGWAA